jgi:hypothetical protein
MEGLIHLIIWLLETRVSRAQSVTKKVRCENCTLDYEYEMHRSVRLHGMASREALSQNAERMLHQRLATECDLAPCPACGWFQRHMVEQARRDALRHIPAWVVVVLIVTALSTVVGLVLALPPRRFGANGALVGMAAGVVGVAGAAFFVLFVIHRLYRRLAYNPNGPSWRDESALPNP